MPVVITGDMTQEEVDEAMLQDLKQQVAAGNADSNTPLNLTYAQAQRILELLKAAANLGKVPDHSVHVPCMSKRKTTTTTKMRSPSRRHVDRWDRFRTTLNCGFSCSRKWSGSIICVCVSTPPSRPICGRNSGCAAHCYEHASQ